MFGISRPILVFIIGTLIDNLIAKGFLLPEQRQVWVDGALTIIGAVGTVSLTVLALHHEYTKEHKAIEARASFQPVNLSKFFSAVKSFIFSKKVEEAAVEAASETAT